MSWVVDRGLDKLLAQINALAPGRSKASDGSIGDQAHAGRDSDHNPEPAAGDNPRNQVDARDFTHDPAAGADMNVISEAIRRSRDRRVAYVIWNRRYFSPRTGWEWRPYTGSNPHTKHMHVSVNDEHNDETQDWTIGEDMSFTDNDRKWLQALGLRLLAIGQLDPVVEADPSGKPVKLPVVDLIVGMSTRLAKLETTVETTLIDYDKLADAIVRRLMANPRSVTTGG